MVATQDTWWQKLGANRDYRVLEVKCSQLRLHDDQSLYLPVLYL